MITSTREYVIRTRNEFQSIDDVRKLIISQSSTGGKIYLKDVAKVEDSHNIQRIRTKNNSIERVRISIFKQANANAVEVSNLIAERVEELKSELNGSTNIRRSRFINFGGNFSRIDYRFFSFRMETYTCSCAESASNFIDNFLSNGFAWFFS